MADGENFSFDWPKTAEMALKFLRFFRNIFIFSTIFLVCKDNFCKRFTFYKGFFIKIQKIREGPVQNETMLTWYKLLY